LDLGFTLHLASPSGFTIVFLAFLLFIMTRSYRSKNHDMALLPRNFGKSTGAVTDPYKTKKNGGGRGNWGPSGSELEDVSYNPAKPRRRSNVSAQTASFESFKTKFEIVEDEPVFIERIHGRRSISFVDADDAADVLSISSDLLSGDEDDSLESVVKVKRL
jgi:hypothetical protein